MESAKDISQMEMGEAGYPATPASLDTNEKSSKDLVSVGTVSSEDTVYSCTTFQTSISELGARLRAIPFHLSSWTSGPKEQRMATQMVRSLDSSPNGFPNLATFLDSDECFSIYRRFGFLQSRLLLNKQNSLRKLEEALDRLDKREMNADPRHPMTMDLPAPLAEPRRKLFVAIEEEYTSYANLLESAARMTALNRPSKGDYTSVCNYMDNRQPLLEAESTWIRQTEDLITLRVGREHALLDSGIERLLKWCHCSVLEFLFVDEQAKKKSSGPEVYYSRQRITNVASSIITLMILALLVVPIYLLYSFITGDKPASGKTYAVCIGILIISTLAFSAVMCLFTRAKRHEVFAAAAAYCAVLVVFFGNIGSSRI